MTTPATRLQPEPRWPFTEPNTVVFLDYSRGVPGVLTYTDITETDLTTGEVRRITAKPSQVIADGISLGYPSQAILYAHLMRMGWHKQKLDAFDQPAPKVERPVLHVGEREGRKWARKAEQGSLL